MHNRVIRTLALCLPILLAGGCATSPSSFESAQTPRPELNRTLFGQPAHVPDADEIFALSGQQIEALEAFLSRQNDDSDLHWQLARFIDRHLSNFDYWGQTLNASQALQDQQGNCMSLAIVTTAFTRHLGLEHDFQLMRTPPTFERQSDLVLVSDHVRTRIYPPVTDQQLGESGRPTRRVIIDYFPTRERQPSRQVSNDEFLAMYYRNVATEMMLDGELDRAFWFAQRADSIDPGNASVLNLLAVIHRRAGDHDTAEALLHHALGLHQNDVNLLHNLHALLDSHGRGEEARAVLERLARLPDHDPYPRLLLARELVESGQLRRALSIYETVAEQLPYLHEAYWGMAMVRYKQGDRIRAKQAMEKALELARAPRHERLYTAKLDSLERESPPGSH
jgi:tetratricopeptide (TPR) repeat protein